MACYHAPAEWKEWSDWLAAGLQGQSRWRLTPLMLGALVACGRRTVTSWLRAAGLSDQAKGNVPLTGEWPEATGEPPAEGEIVCRERLGGLLKHYARRAA